MGSNDGRFYVLNLTDGAKLWEFDTGAPLSASPAIANGIIMAPDGRLYCFGGQDGRSCFGSRKRQALTPFVLDACGRRCVNLLFRQSNSISDTTPISIRASRGKRATCTVVLPADRL